MTQIGKVMGELMPETTRMARFKFVCPPEFCRKIDRSLLVNPGAFDLLTSWDGSFPGVVAWGATGTAKTRACWSALGKLCVKGGKTFRWYSAKRLIDSYFEKHMDGSPGAFWRDLGGLNILFVDDLDKVELNDRNCSVLFEFVDWTAREHQPCLITTNKPPTWWEDKMGDAFARRLFSTAHRSIKF